MQASPFAALPDQANLGRVSSGTYEMGPAERRQKIIKGVLVRQVDDRELSPVPGTLGVKDVIVADGHVEQIPRRHARGIGIVVLGARWG